MPGVQAKSCEGERMKARETMQALLDGKTVYDADESNHFKLYSDGYIYAKGLLTGESWHITQMLCMDIYEEYPLTFEQALRAMLDGKIVMCKEPFHGYAYRFHNGRFEESHVNDCFTRWEQCGMSSFRQDSKWKVVE